MGNRRCCTYCWTPGHTSNQYTGLETLARDERSSLLRKIVHYEQRKLFITLTPGGNVIKHFYVHNLRIFIKSWSVRPWQAFQAYSKKQSSLLQKIVNGTAQWAHLKNVNICLNTNIYFYLETTGGQSSNLYLKVIHFFNTSVKLNICDSWRQLFSDIGV